MAVAAAGIAVAPSAAVLFKCSHTGSPDYTDPVDTVGLGGDPCASSNDLNHRQLPPSSSSRISPRNQGEIEEDYADFTDDFYSDGAEEIEEMIGSADAIEDHRQFRNNDITNNTNGRPSQAILNL